MYDVGDKLVFTGDNISISTYKVSGIEDYQIDGIKGLLDVDYPSECQVDKSELLSALDRIALFVDTYDKSAIKVLFGKEEIELQNMKSNSEVIQYQSVEKPIIFSCVIDVQLLTEELKAITDDLVTIQYGISNSIKLLGDNITKIISLFDE